MIVDFSKQWDMIAPTDTITFNEPDSSDGFLYLLLEEACSGGVAGIRATKDNIPQADGSILHRRFTEGYQVNLAVALWQDDETPACDEILRAMKDRLSGALRSLLNTQLGRLTFVEGDDPVRLVDQVRLAGYGATKEGPLHSIQFTLDSPFPYAMDYAQTVTEITTFSVTLTNGGNTRFWPVFKVYGPESNFQLSNNVNDGLLEFDASRPGAQVIPGGSYVEIDTFRNTAYMNGDQANMLPGFDPETSDMFALEPGDNQIETTANDVFVLYQDSWD